MADSKRSNAAPFLNPDPGNRDHSTQPKIKYEFDEDDEFDRSDFTQFGQSGRGDDASRFEHAPNQHCKQESDDAYPSHAQYDNTYHPNPFSVAPQPPPPPPPPGNGVLRYEFDRYIPPENYFDCDMFYLIRDADMGGDKANCFECGRPKTICPGLPNCPPNAICIACTQPFRTHPEGQAVSDKHLILFLLANALQICPTHWTSTAFLVRYVNWDLRTGIPSNVQIKPNEQEARYLELQGFLRIREYRNHLNQQMLNFEWLNPPRQPRIRVVDFGPMNESQLKRHLAKLRKNMGGGSRLGLNPNAHRGPGPATQPVTVLMPGTKRTYNNAPPSTRATLPNEPVPKRQCEDQSEDFAALRNEFPARHR